MKFRSVILGFSFARFRVHAFDVPKAREVRWTKPARRPVSYVVAPQRGASDVVGESEVGSRDSPIKCLDIAICGGGPAGLLSAIMMAQRFPLRKTVVFDRLSRPPAPDDNAFWDDIARFYLIGIGGRGQNALKRFGVWDEVAKRGVPILGRKDWPPKSKEGVEIIFTKQEKHVTTIVLPRDKLVGILVDVIETNYSDRIQLCYEHEVEPIDWSYKGGSKALLKISRLSDASSESESRSVQASEVEAGFLIAADGTVRTIANSMEKEDAARLKFLPLQRFFGCSFHVRRYVDDNQRVYKSIPFRVPDGWRRDLDYSARTSDGRVIFDALPANSRGDYCGVLLLRRGDEMAKADVEPAVFRDFLDENLPQFSLLIDDQTAANVARKPVSYLPAFRYSGPRLHQGQCCVLLGDSAHTVKPYFGLGANSALEDVLVLSDVFDEAGSDFGAVARLFSKKRAKEAKSLVRLSRELDRPGGLGFLTFILPLILDSLFFNLAPNLFAPNMIRMLQREKYTFTEVARRKRIDRMMQVLCIGAVVGVGYFGLASLFASRFALLRGICSFVTALTRISTKALSV